MPSAGLIAFMCLTQVVGMLSFATFSALLPTFIDIWSITGTEAGWLSGLFYAGYMLAVPVLSGLTDRIDARRVYLWSMALTAAATLAFALLADGFWSAVPLRLLAGAGLAGTYMPGLKALTDRLPDGAQPRAVSFYTASFAIGSSLSYLFAGEVAAGLGWRWAFALPAVGIALSFLVAYLILRPRPVEIPAGDAETWLLDFRPVLRNREAMGYILAYAAHNWELFGFRSWIVVFLVFSASLQPDAAAGWWAATTIAAGLNLLGMPSSVIGNEVATRLGRRRVVVAMMLCSLTIACLVGFAAALPFALVVGLCVLHAVFITCDSASITTGTVQAATPERKGATMALHSFIGFALAFLGSLAPGVVLDLAGGAESQLAWGLAFATMGAGLLLGPLALFLLAKGRSTAG